MRLRLSDCGQGLNLRTLKSNLFLCLLLCSLACAWVSAQAQDKSPVSFRVFKGVNNSVNPLLLEQEGVLTAEDCLNCDLSITDGIINKAKGYAGVVVKAYMRGIYAFRDSEGKPRIFTYTDLGLDYDQMTWSNPWVYTQGTGGTKYLYYNETPSWMVYNDVLIVTNGKNRPWRWNGTGWGQLVSTAPGSPDYAPNYYNTDVHFLHGYYYYAIQPMLPCSTAAENVWGLISNLSWPVYVDSGTVSVFYYPEVGVTNSCADPDSTIFRLLRTRADKEWTDSLFVVATIRDTNSVHFANAMRDSVPDDSLGNADYPYVGILDTLVREADTAEDSLYRMGQIQWIGTDSSAAGGQGIGANLDTSLITHHRYGLCWHDSSTGASSPMGEILRIPVIKGTASTPYDSIVRLALSNVTKSESHLWRVIYRAREYIDTVRIPDSTWDDQLIPTEYESQANARAGRRGRNCRDGWYLVEIDGRPQCKKGSWSHFSRNEKHTRIDPYYPVDTIKLSSDTSYSDTLAYYILESRLGAYEGIILPTQFNYPTVYKNRLYMAHGSRVYYTENNNIGVFDLWFPVNLDDGDEITGFLVYEDMLYIFKNRSIHRAIFDPNTELHIVSQYIPGIGCIAPHSIINMPGGGFGFLSEHGFYAFSSHLQSLYKESGGNMPNISKPIQNHLDLYSISDLRQCHAWWGPNWENLYLSFPSFDTSWVKSAGGWCARDFAFRQTTRYGTDYQTDILPFDSVVGILNASDSIYKYGYSTTYANVAITMKYKTNPLFQNYLKSQIKQGAMWVESNETTAVGLVFYDMKGDSIAQINDSTGYVYQPRRVFTADPSNYWRVEIITAADSVAIMGLDLWPVLVNPPEGN